MKTKNKMNRGIALAAMLVAFCLSGCNDELVVPDLTDQFVPEYAGLQVTSGTLYFENMNDATLFSFNFCDQDGDCSTPAEIADVIVLQPNQQYHCTVVITGANYTDLNFEYSPSEKFPIHIAELATEPGEMEGQATQWDTGYEGEGRILISISCWQKGFYNLSLPVKVTTEIPMD